MLEQFAGTLALLATVVGTIMSFCYFIQARKILARKSVEDISLPFFAVFFIGAITWMSYGISISNFALSVSNIVAVAGAGLVVALYFKYKKVK